MQKLRLPRLISDGMVLQQKKRVCIWGFDVPGRKIALSFLGEEYHTVTNEDGIWEVWMKEAEAGGSYTMKIEDDCGNKIQISDILIGDVFLCSGQSNMELPMERVKDKYPEEIKNCDYPMIRTFKITEHSDFHGPLKDHLTGEWKAASENSILQFSAAAYFFARYLQQLTGIPVGLINASLGGSRIESWMSREMLLGCTEALETADKYADDEFVKEVLERNQKQTEKWHAELDAADRGLKEHWEAEEVNTEGWNEAELPFFFKDTKLNDFIGSVWFRRGFEVPKEMAGKECKLWLGTIVDSDTVFINGMWVGHTDYQYPPRKYKIPEGVLKEGTNTIVVHVKCENGHGRFTPDKKYAIWSDDCSDEKEIDLRGRWKYQIGACCKRIEPTDFVNWKPTGLYYGMTAPCHKYVIAGVIWYQGESNTHIPEVYSDRMKRLIKGYRKEWRDEALPFFYVQLPNFSVDLYESEGDETGQGWPVVREMQRRTLKLPETGMAVTIDLGEDNDLHPLNKKEIGKRLAMLAAKKWYAAESECEGPLIEKIEVKKEDYEYRVEINCCNTGAGLCIGENRKEKGLIDFELRDYEGRWYPAAACLDGKKIILSCSKLKAKPDGVRYCFSNIPKGGLIYNDSGFPMSPFYEYL